MIRAAKSKYPPIPSPKPRSGRRVGNRLARTSADPAKSAKAAHLQYVHDDSPGIERRKVGGTVAYFKPSGERIRDKTVLARIASLVIPPAWKDVWICPLANGHLQATGRDARGRKQYRYHPRWREVRDETKYEHVLRFAR